MGEVYLPGATTIGLVYNDGVILASEKRLAYGSFVLSKAVKKTFKIVDNVGAACAGLVSDMQSLANEATAYAKLYELEVKRRISVRSASKLLSTLLFENRLIPLLTQTIVGGVDENGPSLYVLDPLGSVIQDDYATVGSGSEIAIGIIEAGYKKGLSLQEAEELVIKAMKAAMARDAASGDGIDLMIITDKGIEEKYLAIK
jgi:proteasome beta subunit